MRLLFYLSIIFYLIFSIFNCDGRAVALDIDLPAEDPKLFVYGILVNNDYASIRVQRTLPINSDSLILARIPDAEVVLWENNEVFAVLVFRSDTIRHNPSIDDNLPGVISSITDGYCSTERLQLTPGYAYHLTASAEGYPDVVSDQVVAQERTSVAVQSSLPAEDDEFYSLVFPEIILQINNTSPDQERIEIEFFPWRANFNSLASKDDFYREVFYSSEFDGEIEDSITTRHTAINLWDYTFFNDEDCLDGCFLAPEGTEIIITTMNQDLREHIESASNNSEYLGGFYPVNPFVKHNINGGYGFFSVVEQDTVVVMK